MFSGQKVVVTGGSSGLGKAILEWFIYNNADVLDASLTSGYDLVEPIAVTALCLNIQKKLGSKLDILINNAGVLMFEEESVDVFEAKRMVSLNLFAPWHITRAIAPNMNKGGNIINIASISGMRGETGTALYSATKAGVIAMTKCFAKELAPKSIRVNCISPGIFTTNLVPTPTPQWLIDEVPLKREAHPREIIPVIDMILKSHYMTGSNIVIDGGVL